MGVRTVTRGLVGVMIAGSVLASMAVPGWAIEIVHEGTARPGEIVAGFRAGPQFSTSPGLNTVGPTINFQGLYGLNKWLRIGMTIDWGQFKISDAGRASTGGSGQFSTVTVLPVYLEYRPGRIGGFQPYIGSGIGVNINNKDVANTFAWRAAGGVDYYITKMLALNTEVKYTRNTTEGQDLGSVALLFGVRMSFGGQS
jgi:opacity protein-like surface antigen